MITQTRAPSCSAVVQKVFQELQTIMALISISLASIPSHLSRTPHGSSCWLPLNSYPVLHFTGRRDLSRDSYLQIYTQPWALVFPPQGPREAGMFFSQAREPLPPLQGAHSHYLLRHTLPFSSLLPFYCPLEQACGKS